MSKKIVYLIPRFSTGGAEKMLLDYVRYFKGQGFEILVIAVLAGGELEIEFENSGAKTYVFEKKGLFSFFKNLKKIKRIIKNFEADLVHSHVFSADFTAYFIKKEFKNIKWISTQHNVEYNSSFIRKKVWAKILKSADKVIAVSEKVFVFDKNYFKLKNNLIKIQNGVDIEKWFTEKKEILKNKTVNLAIIGRLTKQKGHKYLFEALKDLKDKNWVLHIFGEGELKNKLKKIAKKFNLDKQIIWRGLSKDLITDTTEIDVLIQPSLWEGLSLVIMEMMLQGKIILASEIAAEELIQDKKTGFVCKNKNSKDLTEKIKYIIENREECKKIAKVGQDYAVKNFAITENLKKVAAIYRDL